MKEKKRCINCGNFTPQGDDYCDQRCIDFARKRAEEDRRYDEWEKAQGPEYWIAKNSSPPRERTPQERRRAKATYNAHKHRAVLLARDGNKCVVCGSTNDLCIDHIIPITKGGGDELGNLQMLCRSCNSRKKNR